MARELVRQYVDKQNITNQENLSELLNCVGYAGNYQVEHDGVWVDSGVPKIPNGGTRINPIFKLGISYANSIDNTVSLNYSFHSNSVYGNKNAGCRIAYYIGFFDNDNEAINYYLNTYFSNVPSSPYFNPVTSKSPVTLNNFSNTNSENK